MSALFLDEHKSKAYIVVATVIESTDLKSIRRDVMALRMKGQRRIHFTKESDRRRREILSGFARSGVRSRIYVSSEKREGVAREQCLSAVIADAARFGDTQIVLERDDSVVKFDRQILFRELTARGLGGGGIQYRHERARDEPLLWIPDAIAWSYARGGQWRERADPLCASVKTVPRS